VKRVATIHTRICVLIPAGLASISLSNPTIAPSITERRILKISVMVVIILSLYALSGKKVFL